MISTCHIPIEFLVSFTISACVEILSYIVLHLVLNRIGRKKPYFIAVLCFAIIALLTIPIQNSTQKNSQRKRNALLQWNDCFLFL